MKSTVLISLPNFSGFYEETGTEDACEAMGYHQDAIDWPKTYLNIAKGPIMTLFEERFEDTPFGKPIFKKLDSPKYYNYRTDEIIVSVTVDTYAMHAITFEQGFAPWLKENYEARSGWIPFFPTEAEEFGNKLIYELEEETEQYSVCLTILARYYFRQYEPIGTEEANSEVTDGIYNEFVFDPKKEWMQKAVEDLRTRYPDEDDIKIFDHVSDFWKQEESWEFNIHAFRYKAWARNVLYPEPGSISIATW